jgi:hypothetical protein
MNKAATIPPRHHHRQKIVLVLGIFCALLAE